MEKKLRIWENERKNNVMETYPFRFTARFFAESLHINGGSAKFISGSLWIWENEPIQKLRLKKVQLKNETAQFWTVAKTFELTDVKKFHSHRHNLILNLTNCLNRLGIQSHSSNLPAGW